LLGSPSRFHLSLESYWSVNVLFDSNSGLYIYLQTRFSRIQFSHHYLPEKMYWLTYPNPIIFQNNTFKKMFSWQPYFTIIMKNSFMKNSKPTFQYAEWASKSFLFFAWLFHWITLCDNISCLIVLVGFIHRLGPVDS